MKTGAGLTKPLVSVCIPTYNGERFIRSTIESVLSQTYDCLEVLISDQHSTDETLSILSSFTDPRIRIFSGPSVGGAQANWNAVLGEAGGKYIKLLCQDDLLKQQAIEKQVAHLEKNEKASFVFGPRDIISPRGRTLIRSRGWKKEKDQFILEQDVVDLVRSGTNVFGEPCTCLYRADAIQRTCGFRGSYVIDLDLCVQLLGIGPAIHLKESLSAFRVSNSSWSRRLSNSQASQMRRMLEHIALQFPTLVSDRDLRIGIRRALVLEKSRIMVLKIIEWMRI